MAFQLYRRHWRRLLAIAAVVVVPLTLLQHLLGDLVRTERETTTYGGVVTVTPTWLGAIAGLLAALAGIMITGAITRRSPPRWPARTPAWSRATASASTGWARSCWSACWFGLAILDGLVVVTAGLFLANAILRRDLDMSSFGPVFLLFIVPGIYLGVRLAISIQALVVEGRRGTEAMGRSWGLVGGHWWHAFGTLLVAFLLTGIVNAVITAPFGATGWVVQAVAAAVVTLPYGVLVGVLLYLDLRARKENLTLERLRADLQASAA